MTAGTQCTQNMYGMLLSACTQTDTARHVAHHFRLLRAVLTGLRVQPPAAKQPYPAGRHNLLAAQPCAPLPMALPLQTTTLTVGRLCCTAGTSCPINSGTQLTLPLLLPDLQNTFLRCHPLQM
jgi:hypothetical protein